ncbi:hypothetical protein V6N13_063733 [Hibiscus sabdariffa]
MTSSLPQFYKGYGCIETWLCSTINPSSEPSLDVGCFSSSFFSHGNKPIQAERARTTGCLVTTPIGWYKLNIDEARKEQDGRATCIVVLRDSTVTLKANFEVRVVETDRGVVQFERVDALVSESEEVDERQEEEVKSDEISLHAVAVQDTSQVGLAIAQSPLDEQDPAVVATSNVALTDGVDGAVVAVLQDGSQGHSRGSMLRLGSDDARVGDQNEAGLELGLCLNVVDKDTERLAKKLRGRACKKKSKQFANASLLDSDFEHRKSVILHEARETLQLGKLLGATTIGNEEVIVQDLAQIIAGRERN